MQTLKAIKKLNILKGNQKGVTLIETVIALALVGIVAVIFLNGTSTAFKGVMISQEKIAAESLANSQLEYINTQDYIQVANYDPNDPANCYQLIDIPQDLADQGYAIEINPPQAIVVEGGGWGEVQSVAVIVRSNGEEILTISEYKVGEVT